EQRDQLPALLVQDVQRLRERVERGHQDLLLIVECRRQGVDAVERVGDVALLVVESAEEGLEVGQQRTGGRTPVRRAERQVQFVGDHLDLAQATVVEQQRQRAEDLLDLGRGLGIQERNLGFVTQLGRRRVVNRRDELDVLLTEQRGLLHFGVRVRRQVNRAVDLHLDLSAPRG